MSVPGKMCKVPGEFQRPLQRLLQRNGGCIEVVLERKSKTNTSDTFINQRHFNWFRLDSDGGYKEHKCTSNISLYCGFKELRYAHKVHKCTQ